MFSRPVSFAPNGRSSRRVQRLVQPEMRWWLAVATFWLVFALVPGALSWKAHLLLGGLCAQRPSHSFVFDGHHLPFDARMTGIYLGSLITIGTFTLLGRARRTGRLSIGTGIVLGSFVVAMGVDGFNSLLLDLGLWHPYVPLDVIRLVTGFLTGVSLGTVLVMLIASSLWAGPGRKPGPAASAGEVAVLALVAIPVAAVITGGGGWLSAPLTLLLIAGAVLTVSALALVCLALVQAPHGIAIKWGELERTGARAALTGILAIVALAALRYFAEGMLGPFDAI